MSEESKFEPMLVRIDERTTSSLRLIEDVKASVQELRNDIESHYVRKEEFEPVKRLVYGGIGFILLAFLAGLTALIFVK